MLKQEINIMFFFEVWDISITFALESHKYGLVFARRGEESNDEIIKMNEEIDAYLS